MPSSQNQIKNKWVKWISTLSWSNFLFLPFILIATFLWLSTKLSNKLQYHKEIHVRYITSDDVILKDKLDEKLTVKLEGKGWDLIFLKDFGADQPFDFQINTDKIYLNKGEFISQLNRILDSKNIQILDINFVSQPIRLEEKGTKKVPVSFDGKLEFAAFYKLQSKVQFLPDSVSVTGPISELNLLNSYPTEFKKFDNIDQDIELTVLLKNPRAHYTLIEPTEVTIKIKAEQLTQKSLTIPVQIANPNLLNVTIVPQEIEISFLIGLSEFAHMNPDDFKAQIILPEDLLPNQQYAVSIVKKPSNAVIQEVSPAYVDVFFDN
jgi:YbbR domain-containing protein